MIFYPNKLERYTASLRLKYMSFILRNGIKNKYLRSIRKIYEFEALNFEENYMPYDLKAICRETLLASGLMKQIDITVDIQNNYIFRKKIFTMLLLNICTVADKISIFEYGNRIMIRFNGEANRQIIRALNKLNGLLFKEIKQNINYCILNFPATNKQTEEIEGALSLFQNPLSVIHLYLSC